MADKELIDECHPVVRTYSSDYYWITAKRTVYDECAGLVVLYKPLSERYKEE